MKVGHPEAVKKSDNSDSIVQLWTSILLAVYGGSLLFSSSTYTRDNIGFLANYSVFAASYTTRSTSKTAPFVFSLLLMAGSILMFFIGTSLPVLLISRILQGASAGFVWYEYLVYESTFSPSQVELFKHILWAVEELFDEHSTVLGPSAPSHIRKLGANMLIGRLVSLS